MRRSRPGLEQVQAFAVSDDPEAQERVWAALNGRRAHPDAIRRALTEDEVPSTDRRAIFIGLEAYQAAGGSVRRDLFDEEGGGYLQDAALLDRLVQQKLEALAESIRAEGWSWTEAHAEFGYEARAQFRRCYPEPVALPEAEAAELDALQAAYDDLQDAQYDEDGEEDPDVTTRLEAIQERIDALTG